MSSLGLGNLEDACVGLLGNPWQRLLAFSSTNEEFSNQVFRYLGGELRSSYGIQL